MTIGSEPHYDRIPNGTLTTIALASAVVCFISAFANSGIFDWGDSESAVRSLVVGSGISAAVFGGIRVSRGL